MLNLFSKSQPKINVIDKVWISKEAKWNACAKMAQLNASCIFITWFEETFKELERLLGTSQNLLMATHVDPERLKDRMIVFAEHYPLSKKEVELFRKLNLIEIPVLSSLDEPLFMHFGGSKTIELMKKLGMDENEPVGHAMITASIRNAQQKLEKKVTVEKMAKSAEEWFGINVSK